MKKKPFKQNKFYIAAVVGAVLFVVFLVLSCVLFDIGQAGSIFIALSILSAAGAVVLASVGYAQAHPDECSTKQNEPTRPQSAPVKRSGHFVSTAEDDDEAEWEEIEFFEMMEDD